MFDLTPDELARLAVLENLSTAEKKHMGRAKAARVGRRAVLEEYMRDLGRLGHAQEGRAGLRGPEQDRGGEGPMRRRRLSVPVPTVEVAPAIATKTAQAREGP